MSTARPRRCVAAATTSSPDRPSPAGAGPPSPSSSTTRASTDSAPGADDLRARRIPRPVRESACRQARLAHLMAMSAGDPGPRSSTWRYTPWHRCAVATSRSTTSRRAGRTVVRSSSTSRPIEARGGRPRLRRRRSRPPPRRRRREIRGLDRALAGLAHPGVLGAVSATLWRDVELVGEAGGQPGYGRPIPHDERRMRRLERLGRLGSRRSRSSDR